MKHHIALIFKFFNFGIAAALLTACTLEKEDYTEIYPENFPKTESDLRLSVNGLMYEFGSGYWNGEGIYGADDGGYQVMSDMSCDLLRCIPKWGAQWDNLHFQQDWSPASDSRIASKLWQNFSHYQFLSKARNTIRRIEASSAPEAAKKLYAGEAKALRGWMALYLYDQFGPVPVATDEQLDAPQTFNYIGRLTEDEFDQMMESDLRAAIEALPEKAEGVGRMTKGAARMILLKYYMIRGKYTQAETLCRELAEMEGTTYSLQSDYNYIFSKEGEGNNEIILQVPCTTDSWTANHLTAECLPSDMKWAGNYPGWGGYFMPWKFYDTFLPSDVRKNRLVTSYVNQSGTTIDRANPNGGQLLYGALALKYGEDSDMAGSHSGIDVVVYRFSDVLLTLAELTVRNNNAVTPEAVSLVNRVRQRAGLAPLGAAETTFKPNFMKALLEERGHEFWLEGLRRQDLIRFTDTDCGVGTTGNSMYVVNANERIDAANAGGKTYTRLTDGTHNRFFIPQSFIDESKSAIKQNAGY